MNTYSILSISLFRGTILALLMAFAFSLQGSAQTPQRTHYGKLSPMLRRMVREDSRLPTATSPHLPTQVIAFVQTAPGGEAVLAENGCQLLASEGDICIAAIPRSSIGRLSADKRILRIEANRSKHALTDSLAWYLNTLPAYEGRQLPQAFTGRDVVVGVMDIGFDLTHPNFYSSDTATYRIQRFWDMLAADTVGSTMPVGRDYGGREELLTLAHARDGHDQTHGTHTLGIAAGSGYNTKYQGMAPESDICIVANAVTEDTVYIDPADYDKYTYALDALGFKYIFDYAESQQKPCVINFSEGSCQDFIGYDQLYYEMLQRLCGPGRIIVSAAGNNGGQKNWFGKPRGEASAGTFLRSYSPEMIITLKADEHFSLRLVAYGNNRENDTLDIATTDVVANADSLLSLRLDTPSDALLVSIEAYPSCYDGQEMCYDLTVSGTRSVGASPRLSLEVLGPAASVEAYRVSGSFVESSLNTSLNAGDNTHGVLSPATAPSVICVGATYYRKGVVNYLGQWRTSGNGHYGEWGAYSSVGPTYDGRIKPDVVAPGSNIISSYSSYYLENHPQANDIAWDVSHFDFNGRTYAWNSNSGTSMASPAVAGAIALWLQAKPDLTPEQVLDVFSHTCRHYDEQMDYPNNYYGYGEIDVYRGLLYILGADEISGLTTQHTPARITCDHGRLHIDCGKPLQDGATVRLFSLSGRQLLMERLPAGSQSLSLPLPRLQGGVYAVQIDGDREASGSTLVRM